MKQTRCVSKFNIMEIQVAMQCNYFLIFYRLVNLVNGGFRIIFMLVLSEATFIFSNITCM